MRVGLQIFVGVLHNDRERRNRFGFPHFVEQKIGSHCFMKSQWIFASKETIKNAACGVCSSKVYGKVMRR